MGQHVQLKSLDSSNLPLPATAVSNVRLVPTYHMFKVAGKVLTCLCALACSLLQASLSEMQAHTPQMQSHPAMLVLEAAVSECTSVCTPHDKHFFNPCTMRTCLYMP